MDLWEKAIEAEIKKKRKNVDDILYNLPDSWLKSVQKEKKKKEKAYARQLKKSKRYIGRENDCHENDMLKGKDVSMLKYPTEPELKREILNADKSDTRSDNKKSTVSGVPPLYECAKRLKERVKIICVENRLYYFDGRNYRALDKTGLVRLYRDIVDCNLHGARNVKSFYELYSYLLTDSEIHVKLNSFKPLNLAVLNNGIYNVKKGRFEQFDSSVIAFSYVDAAYVENAECPRFEQFLRDVTGNNSVLMERMWRFLGYVFTQSLDAKAFFVMGCTPNSGKSLLGKFIMKLYEPQYVSSIALSDFN